MVIVFVFPEWEVPPSLLWGILGVKYLHSMVWTVYVPAKYS
jgi:hypothetical protein